MSTTTTPESHDSTEGYARYNWWSEPSTASDEPASVGSGHDPNQSKVTKQKIESVAHSFLKRTLDRPMLDPIALFEPTENGQHVQDGMRLDLTDPKVYPPTGEGSGLPRSDMERKAPSTKRWRVQEDVGHLAYGGIIPDRPKEELMADLSLIFDMHAVRVPESVQDKILERAAELKSGGNLHDTQIVRRVARWMFDPGQIPNGRND